MFHKSINLGRKLFLLFVSISENINFHRLENLYDKT